MRLHFNIIYVFFFLRFYVFALEVFTEKNILKSTQLKRGYQILIPLHESRDSGEDRPQASDLNQVSGEMQRCHLVVQFQPSC